MLTQGSVESQCLSEARRVAFIRLSLPPNCIPASGNVRAPGTADQSDIGRRHNTPDDRERLLPHHSELDDPEGSIVAGRSRRMRA